MITKQKTTQSIKLVDFPEEIDEKNGIRFYGETSWENQLAVLSHYLHNNGCIVKEEKKKEVIFAIREFLERKKGNKNDEITDEHVAHVAENYIEYNLNLEGV